MAEALGVGGAVDVAAVAEDLPAATLLRWVAIAAGNHPLLTWLRKMLSIYT